MRFHASFIVHLTCSCLEMGDSYIPLLASSLIFPFNFFGCRTPQLELLGASGHPRHPQLAAPLVVNRCHVLHVSPLPSATRVAALRCDGRITACVQRSQRIDVNRASRASEIIAVGSMITRELRRKQRTTSLGYFGRCQLHPGKQGWPASVPAQKSTSPKGLHLKKRSQVK